MIYDRSFSHYLFGKDKNWSERNQSCGYERILKKSTLIWIIIFFTKSFSNPYKLGSKSKIITALTAMENRWPIGNFRFSLLLCKPCRSRSPSRPNHLLKKLPLMIACANLWRNGSKNGWGTYYFEVKFGFYNKTFNHVWKPNSKKKLLKSKKFSVTANFVINMIRTISLP